MRKVHCAWHKTPVFRSIFTILFFIQLVLRKKLATVYFNAERFWYAAIKFHPFPAPFIIFIHMPEYGVFFSAFAEERATAGTWLEFVSENAFRQIEITKRDQEMLTSAQIYTQKSVLSLCSSYLGLRTKEPNKLFRWNPIDMQLLFCWTVRPNFWGWINFWKSQVSKLMIWSAHDFFFFYSLEKSEFLSLLVKIYWFSLSLLYIYHTCLLCKFYSVRLLNWVCREPVTF